MKRLYTFTVAIALCAFMSNGYAQVQQAEHKAFYERTAATPEKTDFTALPKGDQPPPFFSEDFSNGLDGQTGNGAWTTTGDQGGLWFQTFPAADPNGYDPEAPIDGYGDFLPNWYGGEVVQSATRDNGIMMLDADRFNSTALVPSDDPDVNSANTTSNVVSAQLVSPIIDLSGADFAIITWTQRVRLFGSASAVSMEFSVDGGDNWIPYDVWTPYGGVNNATIAVEPAINISSVLQQTPNLTNCRIRFNWSGPTHYFWQIDDIAVAPLPENDLRAGPTFLNNYHELQQGFTAGDVSAVDYYNSFDMWQSPTYLTRPMNFAMEVTNAGAQPQTNVKLVVTATSPSGNVTTFESPDGLTLEASVIDTVTIDNITFLDIVDGSEFEAGQYTYDFEVVQDEVDDRPNDNFGSSRSNNVNIDAENDGFGIYWNGREAYSGTYLIGQDAIFSTPYTFTETDMDYVITHVEAVFLFSNDFAETVAGEVVFFNVRSGSPLEEDETIPETITTTFFDSDNPLFYDAPELEFIIEEEDLWNPADGVPFTWASFELPSPILIEAGQVYQAEYRIPAGPSSGIVFPPTTGSQERFAGTLYDANAQGGASWFFLGFNTINTRFRTQLASNVEGVTYESGVQLLNYPNPAVDNTTIEFRLDEAMDVTFEVYDMAGKLVYTEDKGNVPAGAVQRFDFNVNALSSGVYTYSIVSQDVRVTRKLSVQ